MTSQTDALALAEMIDEDYDAARLWSKYLTQELNHDLLYLSDLKKHGYRLQQVALTPPFASTVSMVEYLKSSISGIGSIAAVAYSVWVEWNSDVASSIVVKRAQKAFSPGHVKGANAHTMIDVNEDHYEVMVTIIEKLLKRGADETVFFQILYDLSTFFIQYFRDLEKASMLITG